MMHFRTTTSLAALVLAISLTTATAQGVGFSTIDRDGNDSMSRQELTEIFGAGTADKVIRRADANGDGAVSRTEALQVYPTRDDDADAPDEPQGAEFIAADTNKDGKVSRAELEAVIGKAAAAVLAADDTDKDGAISRAEYDAASRKDRDDFLDADTNEDGKVTRAELEAAVGKTEAAAILAREDSDKDGTISLSEFDKATAAREGDDDDDDAEDFIAADTNKDGKVSRAELEAAVGKAEAGEILSEEDTDRDRSISRAEFDAASDRHDEEEAEEEEEDDDFEIPNSDDWDIIENDDHIDTGEMNDQM